MATVTVPPTTAPIAEDGVSVLHDVSWEFYEQYLKEFNERRSPHSYIRGELRIMAPSARHEKPKRIFARFVDEVTAGLGLPSESLGSVTLKLKSQVKGAEPDECFLLTNAHLVDDAREYDVNVDPPPDLAIEIDVTSQSLNRLPIYAAARIPEVWVYDGETVTIGVRQDDDSYEVSDRSQVLPMLTAKVVSEWIERAFQIAETKWVLQLRDWIQSSLKK
jgi:Uma2 family endonuclease